MESLKALANALEREKDADIAYLVAVINQAPTPGEHYVLHHDPDGSAPGAGTYTVKRCRRSEAEFQVTHADIEGILVVEK